MENTDFKSNHIEETIHQMGTPSELEEIEYDDSFMSSEDKVELLKVILSEIKTSPNFNWCDEEMVNSLATWKYKKCVNKINVDDYKTEKEMLENDPLSMLKC